MTNIKLSRKEIEKHIKLSPENIEKINLMGVPVESLSEEELELQILPNRPDLLSLHGFLRAFKAFLGKPVESKYKVHSPEKNFKVTIDKSLKDIRPYTACAIVKGLKFDDAKIKEIIDIQEKLHITLGRNRKKLAIGIYPLEKISLPIRFEARSPQDIKFTPLEMPQELNGLQILQKHPTGREYAHLLDGKSKFPVFVDAKGKVLSMPPIINSHETGKITSDTTSVFIECSGFDFNILKKTLNIIVTNLADLGGKIYSMTLDYGKKELTPDLSPEIMKISLENTNKLIGLNLKEPALAKLLPKMGYEYSNGKVKVPAWRTDILHEVDIIEDIAIAYGYENLVPEIPEVATMGSESTESKIKSKLSEILAGLGMLETSTYHLIRAPEAKLSHLKEEEIIDTLDSKTEYSILRPNLMIPNLRILSENKDNEYPQKIFELGHVFKKSTDSETGISEPLHLFIALTPSNFTEIKQTLDYLTKSLNLSYSLTESTKKGLIDGRTGSIMINGKNVGCMGELSPETLKDWNLKLPVAMLELDLDGLIK